MKKIILVYPPFCTPASPPYSLANLASLLRANLNFKLFNEIDVIDLNLIFHELKFKKYQDYFKNFKNMIGEYDAISKQFVQETKDVYSENHHLILHKNKPELFDTLLENILKNKPDIVAFSLVYSSQVFYASVLIEELKKLGITTVIGGPAVNSKLKPDHYFKEGIEFLNFLNKTSSSPNLDYAINFNDFNSNSYFAPDLVFPFKTANSCYYKKCSFCTHHCDLPYKEFDLSLLKKSLQTSNAKYVFIIDDMISKVRCLEIAKIMKELNITWMCQLKPSKEYDQETLTILAKSGLKIIMWGVESASDRILKLMKKGTNCKDIQTVLKNSHIAGIKNILYIIFGFPSETKEEFLETINFLKNNQDYISLISTSVFGLHEGTDIFNNPEKYGIMEIIKEKRTFLDDKIVFKMKDNMGYDAKLLRKNYRNTLDNINKVPAKMNFFREHMLLY